MRRRRVADYVRRIRMPRRRLRFMAFILLTIGHAIGVAISSINIYFVDDAAVARRAKH